MEKKIKISARAQKLIDSLQLGEKPEDRTNPFSGQAVTLEPKGVALHDLIKGLELMANNEKNQIKLGKIISQFDLARDIFRKLYPNEYMDLLD